MTSAGAGSHRRTAGRTVIRSVIVGTDFTPAASRALARAALLPLSSRSRILVVHVDASRRPARRLGAQAAAEQLAAACDQLRRLLPADSRATIEGLLLTGAPHEQLVAAATTAHAELIIVGRHGQRPLADLFGIGTTADRLVRIATVPVIVASGLRPRPYRHPVVAVDQPLAPATRNALRMAQRLVAADARWTALHIADDLVADAMRMTSPSTSRIKAWYRTEGARLKRAIEVELGTAVPALRCPVSLEWGDPRIQVPELAAQRKADLVVIGARTRRTLYHRLLGTVAESALRRVKTDVLVVPEPQSGSVR